MERMNYYYLGKGAKPSGPFQAIRVKGKFYPIIEPGEEDVFIRGVGWVRLNSSKVYEIPLYDGEPAKWNDYKEKYGPYCLYYSIDGKEFDERRDYNVAREFSSICISNANKYPEFIDAYIRMNEIQARVLNEMIPGETNYDKGKREGMYFRPCFSIMGFPFPFSADVIEDDRRLEEYWRYYRMKGVSFSSKEYHEMSEQITRELTTDNDVFPTSVKDRIKMIYGEECCELYERIIAK